LEVAFVIIINVAESCVRQSAWRPVLFVVLRIVLLIDLIEAIFNLFPFLNGALELEKVSLNILIVEAWSHIRLGGLSLESLIWVGVLSVSVALTGGWQLEILNQLELLLLKVAALVAANGS